MSEIFTEYESLRDDNGNTHYLPAFRGLFAKVETPKPFNTLLYIRRDRKDRNLLDKTLSNKLR